MAQNNSSHWLCHKTIIEDFNSNGLQPSLDSELVTALLPRTTHIVGVLVARRTSMTISSFFVFRVFLRRLRVVAVSWCEQGRRHIDP